MWKIHVYFYDNFPNCFPKIYHFVFLPSLYKISNISTSSLSLDNFSYDLFCVCVYFNFSHSDRYTVVSHCFSLHFLNYSLCSTTFHMFAYHLYVFLDKTYIQLFNWYFYRVVCFHISQVWEFFIHPSVFLFFSHSLSLEKQTF